MRQLLLVIVVSCLVAVLTLGVALAQTPDEPERIDYLTFAQGAVPLSLGGEGATMGASFEHAVESIDGDPGGFVVVTKGKGTDEGDGVRLRTACPDDVRPLRRAGGPRDAEPEPNVHARG
ncbi:hypothetical protein [Devosia sp. 66-22]|uniref:hypothetical protein n=1 Tax=Devosia sp. 66-22 TaxID=1895753 RepID=UPI000929FF5A|nr:hypothetical protein [Devosia sp. 66-22]OJX53538.1 MAG: hypothetical protein BGO81_01355 [Devosia sp. 66-22]